MFNTLLITQILGWLIWRIRVNPANYTVFLESINHRLLWCPKALGIRITSWFSIKNFTLWNSRRVGIISRQMCAHLKSSIWFFINFRFVSPILGIWLELTRTGIRKQIAGRTLLNCVTEISAKLVLDALLMAQICWRLVWNLWVNPICGTWLKEAVNHFLLWGPYALRI